MARCKCIGPKCAKCCIITSVWGVIMLLLMGGAYKIKSPALYADIPVDFKNATLISNQTEIYALYDATGNNCFIAAGLYVLCLFFSMWQLKVNENLQAYTVQ